jgi:uncharacterized protein (TIGR04141 family)
MMSNKLSVYLLKENFNSPDEILKDVSKLQKNHFEIGDLYIETSRSYKPDWLKKFFGESSQNMPLFNSNSKAVLLTRPKRGGRLFALTFGAGHHLLNNNVWEENFGLKISLNLINPDSLRSIDKKNMTSIPKHTREQISWNGGAADFGIDIEQDLVQAVTGKSNNLELGSTISGKDSLHVSIKADITNVAEFLDKYYELFESENYKKSFPWIDQIKEIRDKDLISRLDSELLKNLNSDNKRAFLSVPEIIEWSDIAGFKYKDNKKTPLFDDIVLQDLLNLWGSEGIDLDLDNLKTQKVYCYSLASGFCIKNWKIFNCLYFEAEDGDRTYLLSNGKWYEISKDFTSVINEDFKETNIAKFDFPVCINKKENEYNSSISNDNLICLDCKNINYGGGYSKIEFCDLYSDDKKIIHIKKYGGSGVLSHLFAQAVVSAELFLNDKKFRSDVNNLLPSKFKIDPDKKPNSAEYDIILAIISSSGKPLNLPFFSKVTLRNAKRRLESMGYNVYLKKIEEIAKTSGNDDEFKSIKGSAE